MNKNKLIKTVIVLAILISALVLRLNLLPHKTHWSDMYFWKDWSKGIVKYGTEKFYDRYGADYLPFYPLVLGQVQKFYNNYNQVLNFKDFYYFKFPAVLCDVILGFSIFKFIESKRSFKDALLGMSLFLFNPAIFVNSSMWGQVDVIGTLFLFLSFYLLDKEKYLFSGISMGVSLVTKALYLVALPFLLFFYLKKEKIWEKVAVFKLLKKYFLFLAGMLFAIVIITLPFVKGGFFNVFEFLFERYNYISQRYQNTSVNAFNFWGLIEKKFWMSDKREFASLKLYQWGTVISMGLLTIIYLKNLFLSKTKQSSYFLNLGITLLFATVFLFLTRMHERHLYYIFPFLAVAAVSNKRLILSYVLLSVTYILNLHFGLEYYYQDKEYVFTSTQIKFFSTINLAVYFWLFIEYLFSEKNEKET